VTRTLSLSKYQACGNDFVISADLGDEHPLKPDDVTALCDRLRGVGADGVIRATGGTAAPFAMQLTNADGSFAEMSGNGVRCLAAFLFEGGYADSDEIEVETPAGVRRVTLDHGPSGVAGAVVSMGRPSFVRGDIPMAGDPLDTFISQPVVLDEGRTALGTAVGIGNPHLVVFVRDEGDLAQIDRLGPVLERDARFPERTNVEFAHVTPGGIDVRVWERGVGETLACGTGGCAVVAAGEAMGLTGDGASIRFPGGVLAVRRRGDGELLLSGPVTHVFDGSVDLDRL
jgi:diaminopimelate epimerase